MSAKEAKTGCSVLNKIFRGKSSGCRHLQLGKSKIKTGSRIFETCRKNASNYRSNETEVSVQRCAGNISEAVVKESSAEHQRHPMNPEEDQSQFVQKLTVLKGILSTSVNCFRYTLQPGEGGNHDDQYHPITIFNKHTRDSVDLNTVCSTPSTGMHQCIYEGHKEKKEEAMKSATLNLINPNVIVQSNPKSSRLENPLQVKVFWKHQKSPLVQDYTGETSEYAAEEVMVLANEHAVENMTPRHTQEMR